MLISGWLVSWVQILVFVEAVEHWVNSLCLNLLLENADIVTCQDCCIIEIFKGQVPRLALKHLVNISSHSTLGIVICCQALLLEVCSTPDLCAFKTH